MFRGEHWEYQNGQRLSSAGDSLAYELYHARSICILLEALKDILFARYAPGSYNHAIRIDLPENVICTD
jgi:hypothetical protein